jgi:hypothetical protein
MRIFFATRQKIINPPANVSLARFSIVTPPSVKFASFGVLRAENIDESSPHEIRKSSSFFICKTVLATILFWSREVDFFVRDVQISAKENWRWREDFG